jgi:hypothetical protein
MAMSADQATSEDIKLAVEVMQAMFDLIKAAGSRGQPSGELYAMVMGKLTLDVYNQIIGTMKRAGLIREESHVLYANPLKAKR